MSEKKKEFELNEIKFEKPENEENVIEIRNLKKQYKMYHRKKDRLLEIILPYSFIPCQIPLGKKWKFRSFFGSFSH